MKEIVLDTETTGISVKEGHRIVEIGCIELDNLIPTKNKFHCYLNPERKVSEKAFEVHGYSDSFLSDKMKFGEIADDFLKFIKNKRLIIHSAEFDLSHLNNEKLFYDVIYNPKETNFLKTGKSLGCQVSNGKMMFIYQAFEAFKLWHEVKPKIDDELKNFLDL